jgi:hypothetical protein
MAQIHHTAACRRIFGDDLIPEEITQALLALLGERGIHLALDLYNASDHDDVTLSQT